MRLFSIFRIYFSPSFYFPPRIGELRLREWTNTYVLFFVLVSAMLTYFGKAKPKAQALPLVETQWRGTELKTKSTSIGALGFGHQRRHS